MKKESGIILLMAGSLLFGGIALNKTVKHTSLEAYAAVKAVEDVPHTDLGIRAKSAYLMDFSTKTVIYSVNEEKHLPIASMCKIMTLILAFEAIDNGNLSFDEEITVSERAASMGGSQVFLEANGRYSVSELIKSIVVCSANDSCVAIAERVAGGEDIFVEKMNEKAKELGANDTLFANCTGLPKDPQYSCAKDVAIMLKELLSHKAYFEYGKVWMDKFQHSKGRYTEIANTNKLVRFYEGCDGGKTGFTNEAGFCLAATAKRKDMRIISVVIGEESSKNRFDDVRTMFDYAFANYTATPLFNEGEILDTNAKVEKGKNREVAVYPEKTVYAFTRRGEKANISVEMQIGKAKAPVQKGEKVGELLVFKDGVEIDRVALLTAETVKEANFFDCLREVAHAWNARS
ncbi:MAG: D-alanyl-D-alanine carboxypeptidase [Clostridia bacterium]|nr:D-alanyl-D-alanine carboxypeptidase [Clostridia bacterium]